MDIIGNIGLALFALGICFKAADEVVDRAFVTTGRVLLTSGSAALVVFGLTQVAPQVVTIM